MAVYQGNSGNDVFIAGAESDRVNAGEGNNSVAAGGGNNVIAAGSGNDTLTALGGDDAISAGDGANFVNAGDGSNTVSAGSGSDTITAGSGNDNVAAGGGNNLIDVGGGRNVVSAGWGSDTITAGAGNDVIAAGEGNNRIAAGDGDNVVSAGGGADRITTAAGDDVIAAGEGNNTIEAGDGRNIIAAGSGNDAITSGAGDDIISAGNGNNTVSAGAGNNLIVAGVGNNSITTLGGNDSLYGGHGTGLLDAGGGSDIVFGGVGNDVFIHRFAENAGARDYYEGSLGRDTLRLEFTQAEWARADVQADVARFLAHLGTPINQLLGMFGLGTQFTFATTGLTVSNIESLQVVVAGVTLDTRNEVALARADTLAGTEDQTFTVDLLANDAVPDRVASVQILTPPTLGSIGLTLNLDAAVQTATLSFLPDAAQQALRAGEARTETLSYRITDVNGDQSIATVTVTVTGTNDAPTVTASAISVAEGGFGGGRVFGADVDTGETAGLVYALTGPAPEGLSFHPDGSYSFDAASYDHLAQGETLVLTVDFTATDAQGASAAPSTLTITVTGTNDAPHVESLVVATVEDEVISGRLSGTDPDAGETGELVYTLVEAPPQGLTLLPGGFFSFNTYDYDFLKQGETATFTLGFHATDPLGLRSNTGTLTLTVEGTNDIPSVEPVEIIANENESFGGKLVAQDADAGEVDTLFYTITSPQPAGLTLLPDGSWSFDGGLYDYLREGEVYDGELSFTATDVNGAVSETQTIRVTVMGVNDAPVVLPTGVTVNENGIGGGLLIGSDADSNTQLSYAAASALPTGLSISASGAYVFDARSYDYLAQGQTATFNVLYTAVDDTGVVSAPSVLVATVVGVNDAPVVVAQTRLVGEDAGSVSVNALQTASDVDSANLSVTFGGLPTGVTFDAATQSFILDTSSPTYQLLNTGQTATVRVDYGVSDGLATTATSVTWTVQGVTDIPTSPAITAADGDPNDRDAQGAAGGQTFGGNNTAETFFGGGGADTVVGNGGADTVYAGSGSDSVAGGLGADLLYGGAGNDTIMGDANADRIIGGWGADSLTGGTPANTVDTFVYLDLRDTGDTITDFGVGTDKIDLSAIDADPLTAVDAFAFGGTTATAQGVWFIQSGGQTSVYLDTDGDISSAEMVITLNGTLALTAGDFVL